LTVRNAVSGLQRKLGFRTRQQMVLWAVRAGLVDGGSP
jgi:DNA-binding CsgD family transcriptional regulator